MTKFIKTLAVLLLCMFSANETFAYDFEVNGIYYSILSKDDLTCEVAESPNKNYTGSVVIPEQVSYAGKVFSVTSIGEHAFESCSGLTSVTIPNSVTRIGNLAFYNCSKLTSITIPNSVTSIGGSAFYDCTGLTSVTIGNSVTSIGNEAFYRCSKLTSITIPNSVTSIGNWAFGLCKGLTSITIGNSVTSIGNWAFAYCSGLTSITIPNSVTSIESLAFAYCSGLTSITIPNNVMSIGYEAFYRCSGLTSITIPNSVTSIGERAFEDCSGLTSITIGNSVTSIGKEAFSGCSALKEIVSLPTTPPYCRTDAFINVSKIECVVKVPEESIAAYNAATAWKDFWNIVALGSEGGGDNPGGDPDKCATPTIALQDGKIVVATTTEGAECNTSVASVDIQSTKANEISLSGVYTITTYASKSGLWNSESVTATLVWANPTLEGDGIMNMQMKKALLLRSVSGAIVVEGLDEGEVLELYNVSGMLLDKVKAAASTETLGRALQKGQTYIVKAGDRSVKYQF